MKSSSVQDPGAGDPSARSARGPKVGLETWLTYLPSLAVLASCLIYAAHFFFGGGASHLILDSYAYLQLSNGQQTSVPFNTRIATPFLASLISSANGISTSAAFKLSTPIALLTSLLVLRSIIRRRGASAGWQAAVLLAFGCSLAVTFGFTPVLVDAVLLMLACLFVASLDSGHFLTALALACIAALTKEYGLVLGALWSCHAYRRGFWKHAYLGLILPGAALLTVAIIRRSSAGIGFGSWPAFASHVAFEYQLSVLRVRGPAAYVKLVYMWTWCALWPSLLISSSVLSWRFVKRLKLTPDQMSLAVVLVTLPVLLLGDWTRNLIIVVPFSCIVATGHPLSKDSRVVLLLAIGGLSTALARPFHGDNSAPPMFTLGMTALSVFASALIGAMVVRFVRRAWSTRPDLVVRAAASETGV